MGEDWICRELNKCLKQIETDIKHYRFADAVGIIAYPAGLRIISKCSRAEGKNQQCAKENAQELFHSKFPPSKDFILPKPDWGFKPKVDTSSTTNVVPLPPKGMASHTLKGKACNVF